MKRLKLSIYYVRQNFALFRKLVALTLGYNCVKGLRATKIVKQIGLKRLGGKKLFPDKIMDKIFETNSSFLVKSSIIIF